MASEVTECVLVSTTQRASCREHLHQDSGMRLSTRVLAEKHIRAIAQLDWTCGTVRSFPSHNQKG